MRRRIALIMMAVVVSFLLTAISGYLLYIFSNGRGEHQLALVVRFVTSPLIAITVGGLVGYLSKDHAGILAVVGFVPWSVALSGSVGGGAAIGWVPILFYLVLCAIAATLTWRFRNRTQLALRP